MKILALSVMENWGGGEQVLWDIVNSLDKHTFIIAAPNKDFYKVFNTSNSSFFTINSMRKIYNNKYGWDPTNKIKILYGIVISSFKLISLVKRENIDFILANGNFAGLFAYAINWFTKKDFIIIQHNILSDSPADIKVIPLVLKHAKKIVCVSNSVAESIKSKVKTKIQDKIKVIYNGIKYPEKIPEKTSVEKITIGIVGSISRVKGTDNTIKILSPLLKSRNNVFLSIIGTTTQEPDSSLLLEEINQYINRNSLEAKVKFTGEIKDKNDIYSQLDIVINYTHVPEAFSLSTAEAMAYGKIAIAKNAGGPTEIIEDGISGFLCSPDSPDELLQKTEYCIDNINTDQFNQLRLNARNKVKEMFPVEKFKENYIKLFDELITDKVI